MKHQKSNKKTLIPFIVLSSIVLVTGVVLASVLPTTCKKKNTDFDSQFEYDLDLSDILSFDIVDFYNTHAFTGTYDFTQEPYTNSKYDQDMLNVIIPHISSLIFNMSLMSVFIKNIQEIQNDFDDDDPNVTTINKWNAHVECEAWTHVKTVNGNFELTLTYLHYSCYEEYDVYYSNTNTYSYLKYRLTCELMYDTAKLISIKGSTGQENYLGFLCNGAESSLLAAIYYEVCDPNTGEHNILRNSCDYESEFSFDTTFLNNGEAVKIFPNCIFPR